MASRCSTQHEPSDRTSAYSTALGAPLKQVLTLPSAPKSEVDMVILFLHRHPYPNKDDGCHQPLSFYIFERLLASQAQRSPECFLYRRLCIGRFDDSKTIKKSRSVGAHLDLSPFGHRCRTVAGCVVKLGMWHDDLSAILCDDQRAPSKMSLSPASS